MATVDLTVRGAGIFGLSIAWACIRRGARVRVVDPGGVGAGASGGLVGALAPHVPGDWNDLKEVQLESLLMAEPFWEEVETVSGISPGYARTGRLQPLSDQSAVDRARERQADAHKCWRGAARWQVVEAGSLGGWVPVTPTGLLVHDTLSARLHPAQALEALAAAIRARGGELVRNGASDKGPVVWATGWHGLHDLSRQFGAEIGTGVKGQALALRAVAPEGAPQISAHGLHIVPHADGTVAIGSTSERDFDDPARTDQQLVDLHERATTALPILHGAPVIARWAGVRPRARTRVPILGRWPGCTGHFVANGGFKIGFGIAPKVAEFMAALVLDDQDDIPDAFRLENSL